MDTWRPYPAAQQPDWPDQRVLACVRDELAASVPLVPARECDRLRSELARVARGEAYLLQGGDCAETFEPNSGSVTRIGSMGSM